MLVLAILVVLAGVVGYNIFGAQDEAYTKTTQTQMQNLKSSVKMYRLQTNKMPDTLEALVNGPSDSSGKGKFNAIIEEVPKDAWGNDFKYELQGNTYELRSGGADGQLNSDDDVIVKG
jgi:general secretion pathway protein G